jgi:hypothetical protein
MRAPVSDDCCLYLFREEEGTQDVNPEADAGGERRKGTSAKAGMSKIDKEAERKKR